MAEAPCDLVGLSLEWTGVHHSVTGDFSDLSTHTVTCGTADRCYVTADGALVGESRYVYRRFDSRIAVVIYHPDEWQGRAGVVLNAIFDFAEVTDRAVVTAGGVRIAVADGRSREVATTSRP